MLKENFLPAQVDPFRFADNAICLQGVLYFKDMHRLSASLYADQGKVMVKMEFGVERQGARFLRGHFTASLTLQCQRCLGAFEYEVTDSFLSGIVRTQEEADRLPASYDQLIIKDNTLIIQDVFEDGLIISLPIVPMHSIDDCKVKLPLTIEGQDQVENNKENPFKVIESLRSKVVDISR
jgi:uncharacterized protein